MFENLLSKSGLSLERLKTFCEIVTARGITKAAKGAPNRQSQYSRQLKELEEFFGTQLFRRRQLTEAGRQLFEACLPLLSILDKTAGELKGSDQSLSIGSGEAVFTWLLFPKLPELVSGFRSVRWEFNNLRTNEINDRLVNCELDLGIIRKDGCSPKLKCVKIGTMTFALFVPRTLSEKKRIPTAFLKGGGQFNTGFMQAVAKATDLPLDLRIACDSFPAIRAVVQSRAYAGVLPSIAQIDLPGENFEMVRSSALHRLRRDYVVAANPKTMAVRPLLERARGDLIKVCSFEKLSH